MSDLAGVLKELQSERDRLDQAIRALKPLVSMNGRPAVMARRESKSRTLSVVARRRIAAAQRARWARVRAGKSEVNSAKPRSRAVSIAARRKMAAAQKARWRKYVPKKVRKPLSAS